MLAKQHCGKYDTPQYFLMPNHIQCHGQLQNTKIPSPQTQIFQFGVHFSVEYNKIIPSSYQCTFNYVVNDLI